MEAKHETHQEIKRLETTSLHRPQDTPRRLNINNIWFWVMEMVVWMMR